MRLWPTNDQRRLLGKPFIRALLPLAERRGISSSELFRGTSLSEQKLQINNFRLTDHEMLLLLASAEEKINDPHLWQLVVETLFSDRLNPLIDLTVHAKTLKQALIHLSRFQSLLQPFLFTPTQRFENYLQLDFIPVEGLSGKMNQLCYSANCKIGVAILLMLGRARGLAINQWHVALPDDISPLPTWKKWVKKVSSRPICGLSIPAEQLQEHSPERNLAQYHQALSFCQMQHQTQARASVMLSVFKWLDYQLETGHDASLTELAAEIGISLSSCKRLLASHGYSFQQIYDLVRLHKLLNLLQKHPYSNVELAQKLGYSNPNNFRRACKRWLGIVPEELRQQQSALFISNSAL
ncbi:MULTISPECIES: helix-turn-helix transcriptional regulator [unclassified Idiomarina]|jgi:AraC-like DNA-binding protein|nr:MULTISPECIES: helix-turn-helix transcriptional regulator [unclassified Idiomarina]|tara:strand:- start:40801 stop:41859 length:1059 start_codon:yes stop_codon:yes gene_type:complete